MSNITNALNAFNGALRNYEAAKADLHKAHLAAENACTGAVSVEAAAALASANAASGLGRNSFDVELALLDSAAGLGTVDKATATAKIAEIDAALKKLEEARVALDKARAALDTAEDAERSRAVNLRAKLSGIAGESKKS